MPAAAWRVVAKRRDVAAAAASGRTDRHPVAIFIVRNSRTRTKGKCTGQKNAE